MGHLTFKLCNTRTIVFSENADNQNQVIVELLSEIKVIVKSNLSPGIQKQKYQDIFPISTQSELESVEQEINGDTKEAMVIRIRILYLHTYFKYMYEHFFLQIASIKFVLGKGELQKHLKDLIDISLLLEYNIYGLQRKKRLLNYPKFMKAIYGKCFKCIHLYI